MCNNIWGAHLNADPFESHWNKIRSALNTTFIGPIVMDYHLRNIDDEDFKAAIQFVRKSLKSNRPMVKLSEEQIVEFKLRFL